MTVQQYCLRWNNHQPNFISVFSSLLSSQSLVDVTLAAEGKHLQAHKVVLSACSSYFQSLFTINPCKHPIVILKDVTFTDLKVMVDFMYHGEVNVSQEQLPCILKTAEMLKIKGLTEIPVDQSASRCETRPSDKNEMSSLEENWSLEETPRITSPGSPTSKRKRLKKNIICSSGTDPETNSNELLLSSVDNVNIIGTVLKTETDRYTTDNTHTNTTPQKCNGIPVPSIHPGPSHEISEPDPSHHISLQVTQHDVNVPHTVDCSTVELPRTTVQQAAAGMQWNVLDQSGYAHYSSTSAVMSNNVGTQFTHNPPEPNNSPPSPNNNLLVNPSPNQSTESYTQVHKRKRSINPQGDENFIRALEAVRFGGIGFCKAARMYGVNNRTLWLEYKKRGYPNFRLSIKNRNQNQTQAQSVGVNKDTSQNCQEQVDVSLNDRQLDNKMVPCTLSHPIVISGTVYDGNKVDLKHVLHRNKYYESTENQAQTINFQSIQLEQM